MAVGYAGDEHGVDVEPEPEREHDRTVAPPLAREQDGAGLLLRRRGGRGGREPVAALGLLYLAALG